VNKKSEQYENQIAILNHEISRLNERIERMEHTLCFISRRDKDWKQRTLIAWAMEE
jgi:chaperonin cofactor prefoldin